MSYRFDHRQLAEEMGIFFFHEEVGAGLPLWLPAGAAIRAELERFIRAREAAAGYLPVVSPHVGKAALYERSGHLSVFRENMFPPMKSHGEELFLRPMNCPHHHLLFSCRPRSYRELPLRLAEHGQVYRWENSGSLLGLSRARGLCQNDAHIYVGKAGALAELKEVLRMFEGCYRALGLSGYRYRLSKHYPGKPEAFPGPRESWLEAEEILRQALRDLSLPFFEAEDEAAFYGPKIDVQMRLGPKEESVASAQLDFLSAERFGLSFVNPRGESERPWIIHRAPLGSHERFVALLLEYFDGRLPGWLAPVQVLLLPVDDRQQALASELRKELLHLGIRAEVDPSQGSLARRVRAAHARRPFLRIVLGEKEKESGLYHLELEREKLEAWRANLPDVLRRLLAAPV